jgi:hypothetical protein
MKTPKPTASSFRRNSGWVIWLGAPHSDEDGRCKQDEAADQKQAPSPRLTLGEEDREQDHGAEVGDRPCGDYQLTECRGDLAGVFEHRDQDAERGRAEDDRDQQWGLDQAGCLQDQRDQDGNRKRDGEADQGQAQHGAPELVELDLEAGEKEQKGQSDHRDHGDRVVDLDDPQHRRTDHDPGEDLEDHRGQLHA